MLAKIWKKVLLSICILACIYNIMHKLVYRTSLNEQLKSVINQSSILEMVNNNSKSDINKENSSRVNELNTNETQKESSKDETIVVIY